MVVSNQCFNTSKDEDPPSLVSQYCISSMVFYCFLLSHMNIPRHNLWILLHVTLFGTVKMFWLCCLSNHFQLALSSIRFPHLVLLDNQAQLPLISPCRADPRSLFFLDLQILDWVFPAVASPSLSRGHENFPWSPCYRPPNSAVLIPKDGQNPSVSTSSLPKVGKK